MDVPSKSQNTVLFRRKTPSLDTVWVAAMACPRGRVTQLILVYPRHCFCSSLDDAPTKRQKLAGFMGYLRNHRSLAQCIVGALPRRHWRRSTAHVFSIPKFQLPPEMNKTDDACSAYVFLNHKHVFQQSKRDQTGLRWMQDPQDSLRRWSPVQGLYECAP